MKAPGSIYSSLIQVLHTIWSNPLYLLVTLLALFVICGISFLDFNLTWIDALTSVGSAVLFEFIFVWALKGKKPTFFPASAMAAGLGIAIFFRATSPVYFMFVSGVAIGSKYLFNTPKGQHWFNPSNIGILVGVFVFPYATTIEFTQWGNNVYVYGMIAALACAVAYRARVIITTVSFLLSYFFLLILTVPYAPEVYAVHHYGLLGPSVVLFASFMITDPKSSPRQWKLRIVHGISIALLFFFLEAIGVRYALFVASLASAVLNVVVVYSNSFLEYAKFAKFKIPETYPTLVVALTLFMFVNTGIVTAENSLRGINTLSIPFVLFGVETNNSGSCLDPAFVPLPASESGIDGSAGVHGAAWGDYNGDGYDDLFLSRFSKPSRLYENNKDGTFRDVTDEAGLRSVSSFSGFFADYNNDHKTDLFVVTLGELGSVQLKLYRNEDDGSFSEVSEESGLGHVGGNSIGTLSFADFDNNGFVDFVIAYSGKIVAVERAGYTAIQKSLFDPAFPRTWHAQCGDELSGSDIESEGVGVAIRKSGLSNSEFLEQSGCLITSSQLRSTRQAGDRDVTISEAGDVLDVSVLVPGSVHMFKNIGGTYTEVRSFGEMLENRLRSEQTAFWRNTKNPFSFFSGRFFQPVSFDYDNDLLPDIFLSTDFGASLLLKNEGDLQFSDVTIAAGIDYAGAGMGADVGDFNNDSMLDILVSNDFEDFLYENNGDGTFTNRLDYVLNPLGIGWGVSFLDYNLDGWNDIFVTNGDMMRTLIAVTPELSRPLFRLDHLYMNQGGGGFSDRTGSDICPVTHSGKSLAVSDIDNNGTPDMFVGNLQLVDSSKDTELFSGGQLYKNVVSDRNYLTIRLVGGESNSTAIGASVSVIHEGKKQTKTIISGSSFYSQNSAALTFGFDTYEGKVDVEVLWPSGRKTNKRGVATAQQLVIYERD